MLLLIREGALSWAGLNSVLACDEDGKFHMKAVSGTLAHSLPHNHCYLPEHHRLTPPRHGNPIIHHGAKSNGDLLLRRCAA